MRKKFGVLFQDGALFGSMNLYDNVAFPLRQHTDKGEDEIAEIVSRRLQEVGLGDAGDKMPNELSGGMRKRAGFARALVLDPEIVLFDEPDSGLDPVRTALLCELIKEVHQENGGSYVVITHDIMSARRVAEFIAVLWRGRIVESGPAAELFNSANPFVRQFLPGSPADRSGWSDLRVAQTIFSFFLLCFGCRCYCFLKNWHRRRELFDDDRPRRRAAAARRGDRARRAHPAPRRRHDEYKLIFRNAGQLVKATTCSRRPPRRQRPGHPADRRQPRARSRRGRRALRAAARGHEATIRLTSLSGVANRYIALAPGPNAAGARRRRGSASTRRPPSSTSTSSSTRSTRGRARACRASSRAPPRSTRGRAERQPVGRSTSTRASRRPTARRRSWRATRRTLDRFIVTRGERHGASPSGATTSPRSSRT